VKHEISPDIRGLDEEHSNDYQNRPKRRFLSEGRGVLCVQNYKATPNTMACRLEVSCEAWCVGNKEEIESVGGGALLNMQACNKIHFIWPIACIAVNVHTAHRTSMLILGHLPSRSSSNVRKWSSHASR
jgi:hypothetical protein